MRFSKLLLPLFFFFSIPSFSQVILGYNQGYTFLPDLNKEIYIYNEINKSGLKKEMNLVHWVHGPCVGIRSSGSIFGEFMYSWKGTKVASKFDSSGVAMERQLKVYQYTFNYGFGFRSDNWAIGMSFDYGRFRGKGRRGIADNIGGIEYEKLWVDKNPFGLLSLVVPVHYTVFAEYKYKVLAFRVYGQLSPIKIDLSALDGWLFSENLNYGESMKDHFANVGLMVSLQLGKQ